MIQIKLYIIPRDEKLKYVDNFSTEVCDIHFKTTKPVKTNKVIKQTKPLETFICNNIIIN